MNAPVKLHERTNWVEQRAKCNVANALSALADEVCRDVEQANRVLDLGEREFQVERTSEGLWVTFAAPPNSAGMSQPTVLIRPGPESISVYADPRNGFSQMSLMFEIAPIWDRKTASCCMKVGNETLVPWQISQRALEDLFFNNGHPVD